MPTIREWLTANKSQYTDRQTWMKECANEAKTTYKAVQNIASSIWPFDGTINRAKKPLGSAINHNASMNRSAFLAKYDDNTRIRNAIKKGLATLAKPKAEDDDIIEEIKFRIERCNCSNAIGFRPIAQEPEFTKHQFRVADKIFWTTTRNKEWALRNVTKAREV